MKIFSHRIVITGIGPVTSIGTGKELFWNNLLAGSINVSEIPEQFERSYRFKSRFYVPFPGVSLSDFGLNPKLVSLMESSSVIGVVAAKLAIEDAGLSWDTIRNNVPVQPKEWMVLIGTGICTLKAGFAAFASNALNDKKELLKELGISGHYNRLVIPMIMPNAVSAWISILSGIKGPGFTLNASCASGTYAIGEAFKKLKNGEAKMALAGGVECLQDASGTVMRGFDTLGTLTQSKSGKPEPFSNGRTGFLFSEGGACMLVLETLESAVERGIVPYAEIMDFKSNSDANNIVQIEESGAQIKELIHTLSKENRIDYFNSHGTGTLLNDRVEAQIIRNLFGDKDDQPLVNSTKSMTGHAIGASGAIEIAATALSVRNSMVHINLAGDPMDNLNLAMLTQSCDIQRAISASYGFGGHNAALLLGKINSD